MNIWRKKVTNSNAVLMILTFAVAISFNKINLDSVKSIWRLVFGRVFRCATALHLFTSCRSQCKLWLGFHLTNWQWRNHRQRREENTLLLLPCAANVSPQLIAPLCQITALQSCSDKQTNQNRIPANTLRLKIIFIFWMRWDWVALFFANHSNFLFNLAFVLQGVLYS